MPRQHKHTPKATRHGQEYCWTHCVTPERCAANPARQAAHGSIVRIDACSCGATRISEHNGFHNNYGPWVEPQEDSDGQ